LLTLSDNRGRILAETATLSDRFVAITGNVGVAREETFYTRTGDWFAWLCIAVFVSLLAFQLFGRAKTPS
jgi:apolipoprotein N-acyltransferase